METITQEEINSLNELVKEGTIEITAKHGIWGPRAFKTKDGKFEVKHQAGKFYGGGISDVYYTFYVEGIKKFTTEKFGEAQKAFYDNLKNKRG